jgi:hypothetical protein
MGIPGHQSGSPHHYGLGDMVPNPSKEFEKSVSGFVSSGFQGGPPIDWVTASETCDG